MTRFGRNALLLGTVVMVTMIAQEASHSFVERAVPVEACRETVAAGRESCGAPTLAPPSERSPRAADRFCQATPRGHVVWVTVEAEANSVEAANR
jgi:hypothetical protein